MEGMEEVKAILGTIVKGVKGTRTEMGEGTK